MRILSALTALLIPVAALTESDAGFDDLVEQLLALFHVPGLSLSVIRDGKTTSKVCLVARIAEACEYS